MSTCHGCGVDLPPSKGGRKRKWCDNNCRRRSSYSGTCKDCGARTSYSGTGRPSARCRDCAQSAHKALMNGRWSMRRDQLAELYLAGVRLREIAVRLGYKDAVAVNVALWRLRERYGYDLPYRRTPETVQKMRDNAPRKRVAA